MHCTEIKSHRKAFMITKRKVVYFSHTRTSVQNEADTNTLSIILYVRSEMCTQYRNSIFLKIVLGNNT